MRKKTERRPSADVSGKARAGRECVRVSARRRSLKIWFWKARQSCRALRLRRRNPVAPRFAAQEKGGENSAGQNEAKVNLGKAACGKARLHSAIHFVAD